MNRHHNHIYLVGLQSWSSRCYPLGAGCIYPLGDSSPGTLYHHLGYLRAGVPLVAVLVVRVTRTLALVILVLISAFPKPWFWFSWFGLDPFPPPWLPFSFLLLHIKYGGEPAGWYLSLVSYPGKMSFSCHITSPCVSHALPTIESDQ